MVCFTIVKQQDVNLRIHVQQTEQKVKRETPGHKESIAVVTYQITNQCLCTREVSSERATEIVLSNDFTYVRV